MGFNTHIVIFLHHTIYKEVKTKMNTVRLYKNHLIPAYKDFIRSLEDSDVGEEKMSFCAKKACGYLNDLVDYLFKEHPVYMSDRFSGARKPEDIRIAIETNNHLTFGNHITGDFFGYIRDIANASKHLSINRDNRKIDDVGKVKECLAIIRYEDSKGYYFCQKSFVVIFNEAEQGRYPIEFIIHQGVMFFSELILDLDLIQKIPEDLIKTRNLYVSRVEIDKFNKTVIRAFKGVHLDVCLAHYVYDESIPYTNLRTLSTKDQKEIQISYDIIVEDSGLTNY